LADQIGADFLGRRHQRPDTVQLRYGDSIITLDTMDVSGGTRIRAPFINLSDFKFLIYNAGPVILLVKRLALKVLTAPAGPLTLLGKKLVPLEDLAIGHPSVDGRFVVQSAHPDAVRDLFHDRRVRDGVGEYVGQTSSFFPGRTPKVRLGITEDDGLLGGAYASNVDLLYFQSVPQITDVDRLVGLFELFKAILDHVGEPGVDEDEVERALRRLQAPGGIITGRVTLWEGDPPRHDAVDELTRLADVRAVDVLLGTLHESDPILQAKAAHALGEIGDERAVPALIRSLGKRQGQLKRKLAADAADALIAMGEEATVLAFEAALDGRPDDLSAVAKQHRTDLIEALITALEGPGRLVVANAVAALAKIGAVEALPELRQRMNDYMLAGVRESYWEAIEALESRTGLPRPASAVERHSDTLPKPADGRGRPAPDTLPKAMCGDVRPTTDTLPKATDS
jgi:hypothetical protein